MRYPDKSSSDSRCYENFFPTRTSRLRYYSIRFINVRFCWLFSNIVNLIRRKWSIFDVLKSQLSHAIYDNDFGFGFLDIKIMKKKNAALKTVKIIAADFWQPILPSPSSPRFYISKLLASQSLPDIKIYYRKMNKCNNFRTVITDSILTATFHYQPVFEIFCFNSHACGWSLWRRYPVKPIFLK